MKKRTIAVLMVMFCCIACFACGNKDLVGTYRNVDGSSNIKYYLELYANGKCKVYFLGEGEIKDTLVDGLNLYNGTYKYSYDDTSDDKKTGTITITVKYENANGKKTETISGKILASGNISIEIFGETRSFKKQ